VGGNTGQTSQVTCVTSAGRIWMDRNLGASQVATSPTDSAAYGDLYQWGRLADGHQDRSSAATDVKSTTDIPGHSDFITDGIEPADWRNPKNDSLWQGTAGINNPCPQGFRLPTSTELENERQSWGVDNYNTTGAFSSPLKLPLAGYRSNNGFTNGVGTYGTIWSSTVSGDLVLSMDFFSTNAHIRTENRADGFSVRCIKD
jgi:uncharacterized protein (TIGR02145 family)